MNQLRLVVSIGCVVAGVMCTGRDDAISTSRTASGETSVSLAFSHYSAASGTQVPFGLETAVIRLRSGMFTTTVIADYAARSARIESVPVSSDADVTVACVDNTGDTVYRAFSPLQLQPGHTPSAPVMLTPADDKGFVLMITSPANHAVVNMPQVTVSGYCDPGSAGLQALFVKNQQVTLNGNQFSATVPLDQGANTIFVNAIDNSAPPRQHAKSPLTIHYDPHAADQTAPVIYITAPVLRNDSARLATQVCRLEGTVSDNGTVDHFTINGSQVVLDQGKFRQDVPLNQSGITPVVLVATDNAGNSIRDTIYLVYDPSVMDTTPPRLVLENPQNNTMTSSTSVLVSGSASDDNGISGVVITVNGTDTVRTGANFSVNVTVGVGENTIAVRASDSRDNHADVSRMVICDPQMEDNVDPVVSIVAPVSYSTVYNAQVTLDIRASDPGSGINRVMVSNLRLGGTVEAAHVLNDVYGAQVSVEFDSNVIVTTAYDNAHNSATDTVVIIRREGTGDTSAPVITYDVYWDSMEVNQPLYALSGWVEDASGIGSLVVNGTSATATDGSWNSTRENWSLELTLAAGMNVLSVSVVDQSSHANMRLDTLYIRYVPLSTNQLPYVPYNPYPAPGAGEVLQTVMLNWDGGDPDAGQQVRYTVFLDTLDQPDRIVVQNILESQFRPLNLLSGRTYFWRIVASDGIGQTAGPVWTFAVRQSPVVPVNLWAVAGSVSETSVRLQWSRSQDPDFHQYELRFTGPDRVETVLNRFSGVTDTTYVVDGLAAATPYDFTVLTFNNQLASAPSNMVTVTTRAFEVPPAQPTLLAPEYGRQGVSRPVTLGWSTTDDPDSVLFDLYLGTTPDNLLPDSAGIRGTEVVLRHLRAAQPYYWNITARRNDLTTTSDSFVFTTGALPDSAGNPYPAHGATGLPLEVTFAWSGHDPDGEVMYRFWLGTAPASLELMAADLVEPQFTHSLTYGTTFVWRVDSYQGGDTVSGPLWSCTVMPEPFDLVAAVTDTGADLLRIDWNRPPATGFLRYEITIGGGLNEQVSITDRNQTHFVKTGLQPATAYSFTVTAIYETALTYSAAMITVMTRPATWRPLNGTAALKYYALAPDYPASLGFDVDLSSGAPFIAFPDSVNGRPSVYRHDGSAWIAVGPTSFGLANGYHANLWVGPGGALHLAHSGAVSGYPVLVSRFTGTSWQSMDMSSVPSTALPTYGAPQNRIPLVVNGSNGQPTICTNEMLVRRFDPGSGVWRGRGRLDALAIPDQCTSIDMAINSVNTEYAAFIDQSGNVHVGYTLMEDSVLYDLADNPDEFSDLNRGAPWMDLECDNLGGLFIAYRTMFSTGVVRTYSPFNTFDILPAGPFSPNSPEKISLAVEKNSGTVYVAYEDADRKLEVKKASAAGWTQLGSSVDVPPGPYQAIRLEAVVKSGESFTTLYLAVLQGSTSPYVIRVYRFVDQF